MGYTQDATPHVSLQYGPGHKNKTYIDPFPKYCKKTEQTFNPLTLW